MRGMTGMLLLMVLTLGIFSGGCRMPGESGYRELNEEEVSDLASMARGSLLRVKAKVRRKAKEPARPLFLQNQNAVEYVKTALPAYKIHYTGDYEGRAIFEWPYDGWVYQVQALGNLKGSVEEIHWSYSVKQPLRLSGERAEFWDAPDPDELLLLYGEETLETIRPRRPDKLEFDLDPAKNPGISVEGAISAD